MKYIQFLNIFLHTSQYGFFSGYLKTKRNYTAVINYYTYIHRTDLRIMQRSISVKQSCRTF